jgi:FAD/FMN-containing dehydrogenase
MMHWLILHLCVARASGLARNAAAAALSSDAAVVQRGTPGYEALLEKNWVGNVEFGSAAAIVPASLDELRSAVRGARAPVRVVGRGHSFTPVAECKGGTLLSLARLNRVIDFTAPTTDSLGSITIEGGVT